MGFQLGQLEKLENRFQAGMEPTPYHLAQHHLSHPEHNQRTVQFMQPVRTATSFVDISTSKQPSHVKVDETRTSQNTIDSRFDQFEQLGWEPNAHLAHVTQSQADHLLLEEQPVMAEPEQRGNVGDPSTYLGYENMLTDYLPAYDRYDALGSVGNNTDNILSGEELEKAFDS
jgi:hypothetical protein